MRWQRQARHGIPLIRNKPNEDRTPQRYLHVEYSNVLGGWPGIGNSDYFNPGLENCLPYEESASGTDAGNPAPRFNVTCSTNSYGGLRNDLGITGGPCADRCSETECELVNSELVLTYIFSGKITKVNQLSIQIGTPVSGSFSIDPYVSDSNSDPGAGKYVDALRYLTIQLESGGSWTLSGNGEVETRNDIDGLPDKWDIVPNIILTGDMIDGFEPRDGYIVFQDDTQTAFTSDSLSEPLTPLGKWSDSNTGGQVVFAGNNHSFNFTFDSLEVSNPEVKMHFSEVAISWMSLPNVQYRIEYANDVASPVWQILVDCIAGTGANLILYDQLDSVQPEKYYRVVISNCVP